MGPTIALLLCLQAVPVEPLVDKGVKVIKTRAVEFKEMALWALARVGTSKDDPIVRDLLRDLLATPPESTKAAALQAMALEALDPVEHRQRIAHCARFFVDNQCAEGRWDEGKPVDPPEPPPIPPPPPPPAKKPGVRDFEGSPPLRKNVKQQIVRTREGSRTGDPVLSRWAAWGLLACHRAGMIPPAELSEKAAAAWRSDGDDPADLVSCLSIHLYLLKKDWKKDPDI